jgi:hypothetical protein
LIKEFKAEEKAKAAERKAKQTAKNKARTLREIK